MIVLHCAGEGFSLPEISPFAMKPEVQLMLAKPPDRKAPAGLSRRRSGSADRPKGRLCAPARRPDQALSDGMC